MGFNHSPLTPRTHARDDGFGDILVFFLSREFKEPHTHSVTFRLHFTEVNMIPGRILAGDPGEGTSYVTLILSTRVVVEQGLVCLTTGLGFAQK